MIVRDACRGRVEWWIGRGEGMNSIQGRRPTAGFLGCRRCRRAVGGRGHGWRLCAVEDVGRHILLPPQEVAVFWKRLVLEVTAGGLCCFCLSITEARDQWSTVGHGSEFRSGRCMPC